MGGEFLMSSLFSVLVGGVKGLDGNRRLVEGSFGKRDFRSEMVSELLDLDITHLHIDWVENLKHRNDKKINKSEVTCWNLDFTWVSGEAWMRLRMKIWPQTDIRIH